VCSKRNSENCQVVCFDGDGAAIMHLGSFALIGQSKAKNYHHIVINNGAHDSVGGQPTVGLNIDFATIALACGYKTAVSLRSDNIEEYKTAIQGLCFSIV
jgi:phosphonopyruvate decarboxylase